MAAKCDNCGVSGAHFSHHSWDETPTDRGIERREFDVYLCDECRDELFPKQPTAHWAGFAQNTRNPKGEDHA